MKMLFFGTGAADWNIKDRVDGQFHRRLTSVLLNDDLMIDCSTETPDFFETNDVELGNVDNILITHTHRDHYSPAAISQIFHDGSVTVNAEERSLGKLKAELSCSVEGLKLFESKRIGEYDVIAVIANHSVQDPCEQPVNYIISRGDKTIFWGCDSGWIHNLSWHEIRRHKFDLMVFDGTLGDLDGDNRIFEHNNLNMIREIVATMKREEIIKPGGKLMISHMSKYAHGTHEELQKLMDEIGVIVAYDGMEIEF
ncbi:MAG: MBL fold metallo-hydrolase [Clostridia bacterium]|nr:MBL fold metallo-hydrolase [Clostridia bacterium]